jgi:hypothetical protein
MPPAKIFSAFGTSDDRFDDNSVALPVPVEFLQKHSKSKAFCKGQLEVRIGRTFAASDRFGVWTESGWTMRSQCHRLDISTTYYVAD